MLYELAKEEFSNVAKLFSPLNFNLLVESVLHGYTRGRVWVNSHNNPSAAVLWTTMTDMVFAGQVNDIFLFEFKKELAGKIIPQMQKMQIPFLVLYFPNHKWENALQNILTNYSPKFVKRYNYKFTGLTPQVLNSKYKIERITPQLAENKSRNWRQLKGWVYSFWQDLEDFYENGCGFFLTENNAIASWCLSVYKGVGKYELGLATAPEFQGKGMATQAAAVTIEHCVHNEIESLWQCDAANTASVKLAEKLGFKLERAYSVLQIQI